ncbi:MAG TPA: hypothetical protein VHH35_17810 [Pyrinomonadaceae bacterium]|nr:hypothetical protein [Pyrinomonadaceae bacterium]
MTFKVGNGQQSNPGPDVNRGGNTPGRSNSHHGPDHSVTPGNRSHSHDNTPTPLRELETHGNNQRSRVEGHSHGNGHQRHSHHSGHSDHFSSSRSEGGIGVRLGGEVLGLEIEARVGLNNNPRDGGRLLNLGIGSDVRPDLRPDLRPNVRPDLRPDFRNTPEVFHPNRSNDRPNGANNRHPEIDFLRETIRTVRNELNALRSDSNGRSDHRTLGFTERHVESFLHIATRGLDDRLGRGERPEKIARQIMSDVSGVVRLDEHFSRLERIGGDPVRRAYESVLNFALRIDEAEPNRLPLVPELLRDLSTGAFLHPRDTEGPFPLTGRARIVSEMMALMRTIEAIERFTAEARRAEPYIKFNGDLSAFSLGRILSGIDVDVVELIARNLANSGPTFPGMAGRIEVLRMAAALNGVLMDSAGRPLIMADGAPLKLGELLWFNMRPEAMVDLWSGDRFSTRFYPTLLHGGFDAVYSLIGFDGRSLSLPRFIAIQSQINASEFECFFGQAPLSEGWLRAMIEFLKDSISFDHNVLGEMLEEAVTNGRFHFAVMRGTVEEGRAVAGSFTFEQVFSA